LNPRKRVLVIPDAHPTELVSLAWTDDRLSLISGGNNVIPREAFGKPYNAKNVRVSEVKLWNAETGQLTQELKPEEPEPGFGAVAASRDGKLVAWGVESAIRVHELPSGRLLRRIDVPGWSGKPGLALSPDGRWVVADKNGRVGMWDTATGEPVSCFEELQSHSRAVISASFSPDGKRIFTGSEDGTVRAWNSVTGEAVYDRSLGDDPVVRAIALSPDGAVLAAGGINDSRKRAGAEVFLWNTDSGNLVAKLNSPATPDKHTWQLAFSRDGRWLAVTNWLGLRNAEDIEILEVKTGRTLTEIRPAEFAPNLRAIAFSSDGKSLFSVADQPGAVSIWGATKGVWNSGFLLDARATAEQAMDQNYRRKVWIGAAVFSPDVKRVVVSREENLVVWDLQTQRPMRTIVSPGHKKGRRIGLSRDGLLLATAEVNYGGEIVTKTIRVVNLESGREIAQFASTDGLGTSFAFSPDNKRLVVGTEIGTVLIWDLAVAKDK
jgi:WD40 repeat protein